MSREVKERIIEDKTWIEMPIVGGATGTHVRPKYPIESDAMLVYRGERVYVLLGNRVAMAQAHRHEDVRLMTPDESHVLEKRVPFPLTAAPLFHHNHGRPPLRLGDAIAYLAWRIGVAECAGCRRRRTSLNRLVIWGWWRNRGATVGRR